MKILFTALKLFKEFISKKVLLLGSRGPQSQMLIFDLLADRMELAKKIPN